MAARRKREPIYEKLDPGQCYILAREGNSLEYACNEGGKITIKRARIPRGD